MDSHTEGTVTNGQTLFALGLIMFPIGIVVWIFIGCERWIKPFCYEGINHFYWIGGLITGVGVLMFIVGWLLMKEEKFNEPAP